MRIGVYGLGYVGAVTVACLAELDHEIVGVDIAQRKVDEVLAGKPPVVEPNLEDYLARHLANGRITATTDGEAAATDLDLIMLAVGTPSTSSGGVDSQYLTAVARNVGAGLRNNPRPFVTVMTRSTSLPEVHRAIIAELEESSGRVLGESLGYACHPEFLRETTAIADFFDPPVIVFGADDPKTLEQCRELYPGIAAETVEVGIGEAAMVKYAANCFHALKVTFANEMGELCRTLDIDARTVMDIFAKDDKLNISAKYLRPGNPFGGSCLPKDLRAVLDTARREAVALPMLQGTLLSNQHQIDSLGERVLDERPTRVAVIGMAFKEGTDDLREAPMVPLVERLLGKGVDVAVYDDELAVENLQGANATFALSTLPHLADLVSRDLAGVISGADVVVINHRLSGKVDWADVAIDSTTRVLDLCSTPGLANHPGYEGVFWNRVDAADEITLA